MCQCKSYVYFNLIAETYSISNPIFWDQNNLYTGLPTKDETLETTVQNL